MFKLCSIIIILNWSVIYLGKFQDLSGIKFGKLTVLYKDNPYYTSGGNKQIKWVCECDCGNKISATGSNLRNGTTTSCGCNKHPNLLGEKFGKLTVIKKTETKNNLRYWICKCDCGNIVEVRASQLLEGRTKSCGCLRKIPYSQTHNMTKTRLYRIWMGMKTRCYNQNDYAYKYYGARGIIVCQEWINDFINFYNWSMENGYSDDLTIDRIDVNGNYEPNNCRWATNFEQQNNKRDNVKIEYNGIIKTVAEWAKELNVKYETLYSRLSYGWTTEQILFGKK